MKTVIMAGGKGTRAAVIDAGVPKPMIAICGKPVLQYQMECLKRQGNTDVILVIGHLGAAIQDYFRDGSKFGVHISYIMEKEPLGTAGALFYLRDFIAEDFLLVNGDVIFDIDIKRFRDAHRRNGGVATILTHPNDHPFDSSIIVAEKGNLVSRWLNKEDAGGWHKNRVNAGIHMLSPDILRFFDKPAKRDLDRDVLKPLIKREELFFYDSPEYVKDMGTSERYYEVEHDIQNGIVRKRNLMDKQKAVFLDRDGTINKYAGFLKDIDDFELIEGVPEALRLIHERGYLAIVITNQPVIARGELSLGGLQEIHNKMETLLGRKNAYVDDIFFCPHHPDKGYPGECAEYKIDCECRKPKPGLILKAARKYNIDLRQSFMVGDEMSDMEAAKRAGCGAFLIGTERREDVEVYPDLLSCVKAVLNGDELLIKR